ncbi:6-phospho-beta-glucosidase [Pseudarthrobacter psychrotolerans]|uniref:6-phospho-beta-glucosidase n=1 Tax=Pseudarthrobacter psychrotolerans TaxID=2697569 RepID=A0A6P1NJE5_9MICC|nr:6-phospho-beta-glucosidase [Pseudarthrobacter psychrotolerans]QHK18580.1 6-phospho-beta-glucosidase [Pseudarthrobacter psychrotolerans]
MKVTVIGGGSTYTPELTDGFARLYGQLPIEELWLVDPDASRLELVAGISRRIFAKAGHPGKIFTTNDVADGVRDADIVLLQLRIGGQAARHTDETFPHAEHCIGQETTGPGGLAKALRTVPVALEIAETVRRLAKPEAWIIDFTNPVGIVTRALLQAGHRAVGLCNVAIGFQRKFAAMLDVAPQDVQLDHVGLNHLTWETGVKVRSDGVFQDVLPRMLAEKLDALSEDVHMPGSLLTSQQAVPSYYLRYFYAHDQVLGEQLTQPSRAQAVMGMEAALLAKYADTSVDVKPAELALRGGAFYSEAAVELMASLTGNRTDIQVVNVPNNGALPFLPDDHVVEVPARVSASGMILQPVAPLSGEIASLIGHVAGYERLALDAAIHGGRDRVLRAMLSHPLVGQYERAEKLTDALLAANHQHLAWA